MRFDLLVIIPLTAAEFLLLVGMIIKDLVHMTKEVH